MTRRVGQFAALWMLISLVVFYWASPYRVNAASKGDATAGQEVYKSQCAKCHGELGRGDGPATKLMKTKPGDWTDKEKMSKYSDDDITKIISKGGEAAGKSKTMPAFGEKISESDVQNLVALIRSVAK